VNSLPQRRLGAGGAQVSAVGLGCMSISWGYYLDPQDETVSERTLRRAVELGVTHFDTASLYGRGHNETLVGRALRDRPPDVLIASKCGLENRGFPKRKTVRDGRPETLRRQCEASLARLGLDVLDLYYLHRVDPEVPVEESIGTLSELVSEGKIRRLGISECTVDELARAHATHTLSALQSEFSLWTREPLADVIPWCAANGVSFVAFGVLGRGFLTGALSAGQEFPRGDFRATNPRFQPDAMAANRAIVDGLRRVAERLGARPAQVAVAWVLAQGEHVLPIPGTKREAYLEEDLAGGTLALDSEAMAELAALPAAVGARYG
jgi:aryl-alcohol dehydrogenase-like predicted oxidoreductase